LIHFEDVSLLKLICEVVHWYRLFEHIRYCTCMPAVPICIQNWFIYHLNRFIARLWSVHLNMNVVHTHWITA